MNLAKILKQQKNFSEAITCYQNASYYKIKNSEPEFIQKYWKNGILQNPDFAIIGFMKCGTTSLYDYLIQHPQALPAFEKEPHFLSKYIQELEESGLKENWHLSDFGKKCYLSHFPPRPKSPKFVTGEASTSFFFTPNIEKLVFNSFPNIKLIVIMRNPVKRTISHYYHAVKYDGEVRSFEECITKEMNEIEKINNPQKIVENATLNRYLTHSMYVYFLEKWMNVFPKEQFLILENENLNRVPDIVMNRVFNYLNLPDYQSINYHRKGKAYYPQISEKMIVFLNNFFKPHNYKLEEYLGKKFNW